LLLTQEHRQIRLNNAEVVAIGHWMRPMRQKSRIQHRVSTIADGLAPLEIPKTPLFGQALTIGIDFVTLCAAIT
jgi:hypothetical protein